LTTLVTAARREMLGLPAIAWLLLVALVVLGAGIGLRDPWPADEPRFALIARDMVENGQWFFPRVAGVLYADKPPVFFWLIASFYWLTDSLRIAFLLPSLLAALGTLWLVYDLGARLWDRQTGVYAAVLLLVTLQFALQARAAQIDAVLTFWTTLGLYGLCRHLLLGPQWPWYVAGFAAAGAGIITKGVGILPVLAFIPWALARARGWTALPRFEGGWRWATGPFAMLAVIGIWLIPMLLLVHLSADPAYAAYRDEILFRQTATRYADAWHHIKPFWYYVLEVIPVFWLPLTIALPWLIPAWRRDLRKRDVRLLLLLGWIVLVVLFFSVSPGKRGVYLLPAVPALALAAAPQARVLLGCAGVQRAGFVVLALVLAVSGLALVYFTAIAPEKGSALVEKYELAPWTFFGVLCGAGLAWLAPGPRRGMYGLAGFLLSFWPIYGLYAYPLLNSARSPASMMADVGQRIGPDAALGLVAWKEQLVLHADRPIVHFGYRQGGNDAELAAALRWLASGQKRYLLLPEDALRRCLLRSRLQQLGYIHRTNWWLAGAVAIDPECRKRI
jgi:4-amino-4-deoxy-L-arabinose transferase-like glycosyltransferase